MHLTDLGDDHRAQDGAHPGQLVDRRVAGVPAELSATMMRNRVSCASGASMSSRSQITRGTSAPPSGTLARRWGPPTPTRSLTAITTPAVASTAGTRAVSPKRTATMFAR